jgi:hypothetical protein
MEELILKEMKDHLINFVEKPHPAFANLPPCPFAKKARLQNKIKFIVFDFTNGLTEELNKLIQPDPNYDIIWLINPNKAMPIEVLYKLIDDINALHPTLEAFGGHPKDPFEIAGVKTRQEPYPNLLFQSKETLEKARWKLRHTKYYDNFNTP